MEAKRTNVFVHILRLWKVHAYLDLMWMTRDTKFFLICYVSDIFLTLAAVTATILLAERFNGIGHWSKPQIIFMLGYGSMLSGLTDTFFGYNVAVISRRLGRGQFDHTLIQPQPVWMTLISEGFSPIQNSARLLPGLGLMVWSVYLMHIQVTPVWLLLLGLNILASCTIVMSFSFIWGTLAFWAPRSAEEISSAALDLMSQLKVFPLVGLSPLMLGMLMTVLPVGFLAWYPCRALLGLDANAWGSAITPTAAVVFFAVTAWVFGRGMKHYGKTGSQRYSTWGHRS